MSNVNTSVDGNEIITSRLLNAPPELVFEAWTDPAHLSHWYGPDGFTITHQKVEIKEGGTWSFIMHGPDGRDYINHIIFLEFVKPEKLVYKHSGGGDTADLNFQTTVTFEKEGNQTRLTMRSRFEFVADLERVIREFGALEGGKQTVNRLAGYLLRMQ